MNRRDFLLLRTERTTRVAELSCERLYMHYQQIAATDVAGTDAPDDHDLMDVEPPARFAMRTPADLVAGLGRVLAAADVVRVTDAAWLTAAPFRHDVEALLDDVRRRGGRVEYQPG